MSRQSKSSFESSRNDLVPSFQFQVPSGDNSRDTISKSSCSMNPSQSPFSSFKPTQSNQPKNSKEPSSLYPQFDEKQQVDNILQNLKTPIGSSSRSSTFNSSKFNIPSTGNINDCGGKYKGRKISEIIQVSDLQSQTETNLRTNDNSTIKKGNSNVPSVGEQRGIKPKGQTKIIGYEINCFGVIQCCPIFQREEGEINVQVQSFH